MLLSDWTEALHTCLEKPQNADVFSVPHIRNHNMLIKSIPGVPGLSPGQMVPAFYTFVLNILVNKYFMGQALR